MKEIAIIEDIPQLALDMEKLIRELREDKQTADKWSYQQGFEAGVDDAQNTLGYYDLRGWAELYQDHKVPGFYEDLEIPDGYGGFEECAKLTIGALPDYVEFNRGWLEGVMQVWEAVKDKV